VSSIPLLDAMRLLKYEDNGELKIISFEDDAIPPYAILSHTWGADTEEVTFADLDTSDGKNKSGYRKIRLCGQQAHQDGLQYFWVDTCCINKSDKAEHSSAIQSMFEWYRNATRCYVYLPSVTVKGCASSSTSGEYIWESAFRSSRWFKRGWTLQELLAPRIVEFFSEEWEKIGDKASLKSFIREITGIPHKALDGAPLSQFSVAERLRWKGDRETKREEDAWYSMSGIFNVEIAPAYSEGAASAFSRLMDEIRVQEICIQDVRQTDPRDDKSRIEEMKGGLLADSYLWILDNVTFQQWQQDPHTGSRLLWVKGNPGKGKTMLLCGIIDELRTSMPSTTLLSYFFCQATDSRVNSATAVLRGLLYMLVDQQPSLVSHVRKKYDRAGKTLFEDANAWVALTKIFVDVLRDHNLTTCLIIDALDECVIELPKLLDFIVKQSSVSPRVKWIVSSRNWPEIEAQLDRVGHKVRLSLSLELNTESVATAVAAFIRQKVDRLAQRKQYKAEVRHAVLDYLTSNANDTFLWVALVCQELEKTANRHALRKLALLPPGLDDLYKRMMQQMNESDDADTCRCVLASVAVLYRPVTIHELVALVEQLEDLGDDVREIISLCGSFLTIRKDIVYFVHQSAKDFLFTKESNDIFPGGAKDVHRVLYSKSLVIMSKTLHKDMYNLKALGFPVQNVKPPDPDPLAASRYPCIHWIDHLYESEPRLGAGSVSDQQVKEEVDQFLRETYLYWLEGLSLCKSVEKGVVSMARLWSLMQVCGTGPARLYADITKGLQDEDKLAPLVQDAHRFIMYHHGSIERYPLQTYASALLFSPTGSLIRQLFQHEEPMQITIKPPMSESWSACLQTLEGHSDTVWSVTFSHDSARLASAASDATVKIWDMSGACLQTLSGHSSDVYSVAFSHDSAMLASASGDMSIKIWDMSSSSGTCLQTLEGHFSVVRSVSFSHDSVRLASASDDETVKIWDICSGACLQTLEDHNDMVRSVAFSHDSVRLASASYDNTVKIWDISSGACLETLEGHSDWVYSVAFSHDSARLASTSVDGTIKIWDMSSSGACLQTLKGHSSLVCSVVFSHDSARLASASGDTTVKIWDMSTGTCLQTLKGHSGWVRSVAFSSHDSARLASASNDTTVKIWDTSSSACLHTPESHSDKVRSVAFSDNSARLASASEDNTVRVWDTNTGSCLQTLKGHSGWVRSVAFSSHDLATLASASDDKTVKIWDANTGVCLQTLKGHGDWVRSVVFCSHNSAMLASASKDTTVKIWDVSTGACLQTHQVGETIFKSSFDSTGSVLQTATGTIVLQLVEGSNARGIPEPERPLYTDISSSSDNTWITHAGKNMLWMPSEYRPSCSSVSGKVVGIGVGSGRVWFCSINL
jgi:WD40 repeat protein